MRPSLPAAGLGVWLAIALTAPGAIQANSGSPEQAALARALHGIHAAGLAVDWQTGAVLAQIGDIEHSATPGSAVKPLLLAYALDHGVVRAESEVYCRRDLRVGGLRLSCTHPADRNVFTAQSALAESCNTWFAAMGRRFSGPQLEAAFESAQLPHSGMAAAGDEPRELAVLGLRGVTATPAQMARAYRGLLAHLPMAGPVALGLKDSVEFGMANPAAVPGVTILGKTGTASTPGEAWTHGWFAGALPGRLVLVVFVPRGDGGDAARLAHAFFVEVSAKGKRL